MTGAFSKKTLDDWRTRLDRFNVTFGAVTRSEDLPNDPQLESIGAFRPIHDSAFRTIDSPIHLDGVEKRAPSPAPEIGENSVAVLRSLGYPDERIEALRLDSIVRTAD